jgi:hypothetical protein
MTEGRFRWPSKPLGGYGLTIAVLTSIAILVAVFLGGWAVDLLTGSSQSKEATRVVERFMQLMLTKRAAAAESLFARPRGDPDDVHGQLQAMSQGLNYVLFDGYRALATDGYRVERTQYCVLNSHTIALTGMVSYDDGSRGRFTATLTDDEGDWEILKINVIVPPSKALNPVGAP